MYTGKIYWGSELLYKIVADTKTGAKRQLIEFLQARKNNGQRLSGLQIVVQGPNNYWYYNKIK